MKTLILTLLLAVTGLLLQAQTKISGTLKSKKGLPVANANIAIKNSYDGSSTDSSGHFSFVTNEKGMQTLQFSALNYETGSMRLELTGLPLTINPILKEALNVCADSGK